MKKQYYIDMGIASGLTPQQIESVLCRVLQISREELFILKDISSKHIYDIQQIFYEMSQGKLEEYSLQKANFYGRDFFVDDRVLIPRNDTELLVDVALKNILRDIDVAATAYIDLGTGSGCIAATIIEEMRPLQFAACYALDICQDALDVARENFSSLGIASLCVAQSDLLHYFGAEPLGVKNLCITANLPYVREGDSDAVDRQVDKQEPHIALYGGKNTGFELYEKCIKQCFHLKHILGLTQINLFIEIGYDQREVSERFLSELGLLFEYFSDSASIDRVIHVKGF